MTKRHPHNPNLTLHYDPVWDGFEVQADHGPLVKNYLQRIHQTLLEALADYNRLSVMRFDLHFPSSMMWEDSAVISRFMAALEARLAADINRKKSKGQRTYKCRLRYVWVRERASSKNFHYHVVIFLNRDAYFTLGKIPRLGWQDCGDSPLDEVGLYTAEVRMNMISRIQAAWASAMGFLPDCADGFVHVPKNAVYHLDRNSSHFWHQLADVIYRLSYMAKADTKCYGEGGNNFGSSRG
jgi:hypothetical protein